MFYINLPLGILALLVIASTLPVLITDMQPQIDYLGTALLGAATTCIILLTTLGGNVYSWASAQSFGLGAAAVILLVLFLLAERRAPEPVLPLSLLSDRVFALASLIAFVAGFALVATTAFLPLFLQEVQGAARPTRAWWDRTAFWLTGDSEDSARSVASPRAGQDVAMVSCC